MFALHAAGDGTGGLGTGVRDQWSVASWAAEGVAFFFS
jgi:hypothetical protein